MRHACVAAVTMFLALPAVLSAKGPTTRIVILDTRSGTTSEIRDRSILDRFNVWAGRGTFAGAPGARIESDEHHRFNVRSIHRGDGLEAHWFRASQEWQVAMLDAGVVRTQLPDFTGHWFLAGATGSATNQAASLSVTKAETWADVRGVPMPQPLVDLTVDRSVAGVTRTERYTIGVQGGSVGGLAAHASGAEASVPSRTSWSVRMAGDQLVFETGEYSDVPDGPRRFNEHREVWSLDPIGRLVILIVDRGSGAAPDPVTLTYERR